MNNRRTDGHMRLSLRCPGQTPAPEWPTSAVSSAGKAEWEAALFCGEEHPNCHSFADPYVEHDPLIVLLDLILLKRGVYRHLLFNHGALPRRLDREGREVEVQKGEELTEGAILWSLGLCLTLVDAFIRHSSPQGWTEDRRPYTLAGYEWTTSGAFSLGRTFLACLLETITFHLLVILGSWGVLFLRRTPSNPGTEPTYVPPSSILAPVQV
ncbi:hypothetical protein DACRYDRAFT_104528 [Dacryopinax primogenitus]|uniref:Protein ARV n=1 Tax=Dacryopinax primogenitus (strain DJM 731) TaxID=1858805 RepID=M5G7E2_DACPD|nr:uncharacterized protein DACRYDRAFT_104528 [Dacryopinax primogenitus]EJU04649.1 hypothetical protein DACRYDRAFT_104528 [Dacryopinax primogenitus]